MFPNFFFKNTMFKWRQIKSTVNIMFCGECGTENAETRKFCTNCGKPLRSATPAPGAQPAAAPVPPVAPLQPVYAPVPAPQPIYSPPPAGTPAPARPPLNKGLLGLGIVGLGIALVSWFRYPYICGLLAMVLGVLVIARSDNRKGAVALVAALAILIGLAAIIVDLFYFTIFPVHAPVF
jgi:hypothetical protein